VLINDVKKIVDKINEFINGRLWLDFEMIQYQNHVLTITGSIDTSYPYDIEIKFEDIFFISLPIEWKTDTSKVVLKVLEGEEAISINKRFQVEQGYYIFKFIPEDYNDDFGCLVGAKKIYYNQRK
jgi:hypothetical protein